METTRQKKIAQLIEHDMSEILNEMSRNALQTLIITVTKVRISPDLSIAKVYLSIYPVEDKVAVLKEIDQHKTAIRNKLSMRVKNQIRKIPNLTFYIDDSLDYIEGIERELEGKGDNPKL